MDDKELAKEIMNSLQPEPEYIGHKAPRNIEKKEEFRTRLAQPEQNVSYAGNGTASKENTTAPNGFFFHMSRPKPEECYSCGSIHSAYVRHCAKCGYMKGLENPEWTNKGKLQNVTIVFKDIPSYTISRCSKDFDVYMDGKKANIYIAPPKKEWVGFNNEELIAIWNKVINNNGSFQEFYALIEAKLKEKNT